MHTKNCFSDSKYGEIIAHIFLRTFYCTDIGKGQYYVHVLIEKLINFILTSSPEYYTKRLFGIAYFFVYALAYKYTRNVI